MVQGRRWTVNSRWAIGVAAVGLCAAAAAGWFWWGGPAQAPAIGLITKTNANPFFAKMTEGAEASARVWRLRLLTAAGRADGDHESQVRALRAMVDAGVRAVLITPSNAQAIVPEIRSARDKGVLVIALDSPTDPAQAVDATFGTNNFEAGRLIGHYAAALVKGRSPRVAMVDASPGNAVSGQRHNGCLAGLGLPTAAPTDSMALQAPAVACAVDSQGDAERAFEALARCLREHPDVDLVYTVNEPAAAGARRALNAAGKAAVPLVSIDGGCQGVRDVAAGHIAATAQQYPLSMAMEGVAAAAAFIRSGQRPPPAVDTQVMLITDAPQRNVDSRRSSVGLQSCWG